MISKKVEKFLYNHGYDKIKMEEEIPFRRGMTNLETRNATKLMYN
jgi:hypothetical protein